MNEIPYREAVRIHTSVLARVEKAVLVWMAGRLPRAVNSDHLTVLGAVAMLAAGLCYWVGTRPALAGAIAALAVNWFGDSLDGTVARVRHHERPRYGFYVDHVLDAIGILLVVGGLALGGHVSPAIAAGFLIAYYLLTIEIALATHAVGTFRISFWRFGPTELRLLLALGTWRLMSGSMVTIGGVRFLLFDLGMAIGTAGLLATFLASAAINTRTLYRREPLPQRDDASNGQLRADMIAG